MRKAMDRARTPAFVWLTGTLLALLLSVPGVASAAVYSYVAWSAADVAKGTASGLITLPDQSTVRVSFAAITATGAPGTLYGAQINGQGTNYWIPSTPYISSEVENAPPDPDILRLSGGDNETYTVTLSEPIKDPIMAIVSLGQVSATITYNFDAPFTIVSQGVGYYGGGATALVQLPDNVLQGSEGHGTIQFLGTFSTFSWTVPKPEAWHGFTFGIRTTERLEPTPDGGAGGQGGQGGGTGGAVATGGRAGTGGVGGFGGYGGSTSRGGAGGAGNGGAGTGGSAGSPGNGGSAGAPSRTGNGGGGAPGLGGRGGSAGRGEPAVAGLVGGRFGTNPGGNPSGAAGGQGQAGGAGGSASGGAAGAGATPIASGGGCSCGVGSEEAGAGLGGAALTLALATLFRSRRGRRPA